MRPLIAGLLLALVPLMRAQGQDTVIVLDPNAPLADSAAPAGPPPEIVQALLARYNDSSTARVQGDFTLPAGSEFTGTLAVYHGALRIAGRVQGAIVVANGTLYLLPGAEVLGDILVVGGRLVRSDGAQHRGAELVYWNAAPVAAEADGRLALRERRRSLGDLATARASFQTGRVRTTLAAGTAGTYNRIEGLPIFFGPQFVYHPSRWTTLRADIRGLLRTSTEGTGLRDDFGYTVRAALRVEHPKGEFPAFGMEGRLYSVVDAIEDQLSASEVGWAAVLLQRDYRDYFERRGVAGLVYVQPLRPLRFELSLQRDAEGSVRATDPWSLFRNTDRWRRNPLIDDGHYTTAGFGAQLDTRDAHDAPSSGWLLSARYEHVTSNDVAPVALPTSIRPTLPAGGGYGFDRLRFDARRYQRLTPELRVNARVRADGWVTGDRLPIQQRVSLGGPDLLPGYDFHAFTCDQPGVTDEASPALCDRSLAAQLEVRTRLHLGLGHRLPAHEAGRTGMFLGIESADLVIFSDAGKAWLAGDGPGQVAVDAIPVLREWKYDIGVGLDAGEIGAYLAKGLSQDEPVHFFIRLRHRF